MSGDWLKFETATSDKPEVWQMASILGIDPDAVVGKLLRVWVWFDVQSTNGNAPSVTKSLLDRKVGVTGFCDAMIQAEWMLDKGNEICLPNFDRHNGQTAKTRAQTSKRVGKHRKSGEHEGKCNGDSVTPALQNPDTSVTDGVTPALPEKRREEKSKKKEYSDDFERFWSAYPSRRKTGKTAAYRLWKKALKDGVDAERIIKMADLYAKSESGSGQYSLSTTRWLNEGRWEDDISAWGGLAEVDPSITYQMFKLNDWAFTTGESGDLELHAGLQYTADMKGIEPKPGWVIDRSGRFPRVVKNERLAANA